MIPDESLREIATKLLDKSRAGKVLWRRAKGMKSAFVVDFPGAQLIVAFVRPVAEADYVRLSIEGPDRQEVGCLVADESIDNQELWQLLRDVYVEAEKKVTGWDKVLREIVVQLDDQGQVGVPTEPSAAQGVPF